MDECERFYQMADDHIYNMMCACSAFVLANSVEFQDSSCLDDSHKYINNMVQSSVKAINFFYNIVPEKSKKDYLDFIAVPLNASSSTNQNLYEKAKIFKKMLDPKIIVDFELRDIK